MIKLINIYYTISISVSQKTVYTFPLSTLTVGVMDALTQNVTVRRIYRYWRHWIRVPLLL